MNKKKKTIENNFLIKGVKGGGGTIEKSATRLSYYIYILS